MRRVVRSIVMASALALLTGCGPGAAGGGNPAADEQAIRGLVSDWNGFLASANDSAIANLYSEDAVLLPPGMPRVTGHAQIREFWAGIWPLKATLQLSSLRVQVSGDWAVEEGNWTWSAPQPAGPQEDHGKYLVTWHRTPGGWKAVQDIWNSDNSPPAPVN